jgi:hypothetical protein
MLLPPADPMNRYVPLRLTATEVIKIFGSPSLTDVQLEPSSVDKYAPLKPVPAKMHLPSGVIASELKLI